MMQKVILGFLAAAVVGTGVRAQAELQQSNTVASKELITDFALVKDASETDVVANLALFKDGGPEKGPSLLAISANETITLSVDDKSVVCQADKDCRLPFIKGATYRAELKRFNGEIFKAETQLPNETKILSPVENTIVKPTDPVHFEWVVARDNGPRGITVSVYLGEQVKTCNTHGGVNWETEGTATVPANYIGNCIPPLNAKFGVFYVNAVPMPGVAGGTLKGYSTARLHFSYLDTGVSVDLVRAPLTKAELHELTTAAREGKVSTQTLQRR